MTRYIESPDGKSAIVADPDRPRLAGHVLFVPQVADPASPTLAELPGWDARRLGGPGPVQQRQRAGGGDVSNIDRDALADQLEAEIRPLLDVSTHGGGYNCCGCGTYDDILDHAIRVVRGDPAPVSRQTETTEG